tara:strand:- start:1835 stop:2602 length:768 start_codon:yes stop_codon:yes gene_type:complete
MAFKMKAGSDGPMRKNFPHVFKKDHGGAKNMNYSAKKMNYSAKKKIDEFGEYIDDAGSPVQDPANAPSPRNKSKLRQKIDAGRVRRKTRKAQKLKDKAANLRENAANDPRSRKRADRLERRATNKEKRANLKQSQAKNITEGKDKMANVTDDRTTMQALRGGKNVTFGDEGRKGDKVKTDAVIGDVAPENKAPKEEPKKSVVNDEMSFSEAYRAQRNANKKAGIAHYGDKAGNFTWRGKTYNTESRSEKAKRTGK